MNKFNTLLLVILCGLLTACGAEKKQQVIIPQAQLQALDKAKNLENELLKMQQQKEEQLKAQGL
ncbi:MAG: outer membrane lipopolysaccharide assembly protein LptE/RlpB [Psychromonas sp.]|jgi:outer membrane lipopolysaccharide assembly protein LptE/RlpB|uniref:hypothetical protein n=1 Tax=Psychromonas sp. TaxID=1884585 RepID=UPI0039E4663F